MITNDKELAVEEIIGGSSNIPNSGAEVKVYRGTTLVWDLHAPPAPSGQLFCVNWGRDEGRGAYELWEGRHGGGDAEGGVCI